MARIEHLHVEAHLDESPEPLERARAESARDEEWAAWLDQHGRREALVVALRVTVSLSGDGGETDRIELTNRGVWLENDPTPPRVAQQVRDLVAKDFEELSGLLAARGIEAAPESLAEMHVDVTLGEDLRARLGPGPAADGEVLRRVEA